MAPGPAHSGGSGGDGDTGGNGAVRRNSPGRNAGPGAGRSTGGHGTRNFHVRAGRAGHTARGGGGAVLDTCTGRYRRLPRVQVAARAGITNRQLTPSPPGGAACPGDAVCIG